MSILDKKANEILQEARQYGDEKYGVLITIAYILIIIVNSIRLYRLCKDKDEEFFPSIATDFWNMFFDLSI